MVSESADKGVAPFQLEDKHQVAAFGAAGGGTKTNGHLESANLENAQSQPGQSNTESKK